ARRAGAWHNALLQAGPAHERAVMPIRILSQNPVLARSKAPGPPHSITSSARNRDASDIVRFRAFAVLRLMRHLCLSLQPRKTRGNDVRVIALRAAHAVAHRLRVAAVVVQHTVAD